MLKIAAPFALGLLCAYPSVAQDPTIGAVVNAASYANSLAPGAVAAVYGDNLFADGDTIAVTVNDLPAFVLYASAMQVNVQLPVEADIGSANLVLTRNDVSSAPFAITLDDFAPGQFFSPDGTGLFLHADGTLVTADNPAQPGETLSGLANALGPTDPPVATGEPAPNDPLALTLTNPSMTVGGQDAPVAYACLAPGQIGLYLVFFTAPDLTGNQDVVLTIGDKTSNTVTLPMA